MTSQKVKSALAGVSSGATSLRRSWSGGNVPGYHESTAGFYPGDEEFDFDDMVINSTAYRRIFVKQRGKYQMWSFEDTDDAADILTPKREKAMKPYAQIKHQRVSCP
jgi:hypothetical protein